MYKVDWNDNDSLGPIFSIVIPTFNRAELLEKAIVSILNQKFQNWELIIVDNTSTDNTSSIIDKYIRDHRIYFYQIRNDGIIAKSRNYGISKAKGEWLCFLDSDDQFTPNKLDIIYNNISDKYDFLYHSVYKVNYNTNKLIGKYRSDDINQSNPFKNLIFGGQPFATSSVVVRKNVICDVGCFSENRNFVACEDFHCWLKISLITTKFKFINHYLGSIYVHNNNTSNINMSLPLSFVYEYFSSHLNSNDLKATKMIVIFYNIKYILNRRNYLSLGCAGKDVVKFLNYRVAFTLFTSFFLIKLKRKIFCIFPKL